jgi:hypothetical protein
LISDFLRCFFEEIWRKKFEYFDAINVLLGKFCSEESLDILMLKFIFGENLEQKRANFLML